ncbi:hypothetical protein [Anaerosporobacter sp.]
MKNKSILILTLLSLTILLSGCDKEKSEQYLYYEQPAYMVDGTMTTDFIDDTVQAINLIPRIVLSNFLNEGWQFIICNTEKNYCGLTDVNNKVIYIYYKECDTTTIADTVMHEIGHYVDYSQGFISKTKEFDRLYNMKQYKDTQRNDNYCYKNNQELFATLYRDYILYNNHLKYYYKYYQYIYDVNCIYIGNKNKKLKVYKNRF